MKRKYILLMLISLLFIWSCQDDFLERTPISSYSSGNMWQTADEATAGVLSIYSALGSALDMNYCYWGEARAANYVTNPPGWTGQEQVGLVNNTLQQTFNSADWAKLYTVIMRANTAVEKITDIPDPNLTASQRKDLMGEAFYLRALTYFYLIRVWGDVPLVKKTISNPNNKDEIYIKRESAEKVWEQIISDLDAAEENLTMIDRASDNSIANFKLNRSRVTRPAVWALKTDVFLWMKNYSRAIENAEKFTTANRFYGGGQYKLTNKVYWPLICQRRDASVFNNVNMLPYECIFEIGFNYDDETSHGTFRNAWHMGLNYFSPTVEYLNLFYDPGDIRDSMYNQPLFKIYKFKGVIGQAAVADAIPNDQPMIIYRLTDVLMLNAEALNRRNQAGDRAKAIDLLKFVRRRGGCADSSLPVSATSTMDEIELEIVKERARELLGEGKLWFDYRRTGKVIELLKPVNGFSDARFFVWPIHTDRLKEYPAGTMVQNPGYGD